MRITRRELDAVFIAWDELCSYIDTVGQEGSLDDEEMPTEKLRWAERELRYLLARNGMVEVSLDAERRARAAPSAKGSPSQAGAK